MEIVFQYVTWEIVAIKMDNIRDRYLVRFSVYS